jgi:tyrosinase
MANMYSSPGDPLFWLHHSMIDHVWDQWQRKNFAVRSKDIGGPDTMWAYPYNYFDDIPYKNITLQRALNFHAAKTLKPTPRVYVHLSCC